MLNRIFTAGFAATLSLTSVATAQTVEEFYSDKQITFVVGTGAGGGYGLYAEILAKHMPQYIPGNPALIVQYMPGAGGATATAYMDSSAARDGTVIATLTQSGALFQVLDDAVEYDAANLTYIGRMATANAAGLAWAASGVKTLDDVKTTEVVFGATGRGDQSYMFPTLLKNLYGYKFRVVTGYPGTSEMNLAIERGEIDGRVGAWTSWKTAASQWIEEERIFPILEVGLESSPDLEGVVPLVTDLATNEEEKQLLRLMSSYAAVGRAISSAPGIPEDRLAALREAFDQTMTDPKFLAEAQEVGVPIEPLTGAEVAAIVTETVNAPDELVARAKELLEY